MRKRHISFIFTLVGIVLTILILPHKHEPHRLIIYRGMNHSDQISTFRQIAISGHILFWLSHLRILKYGDYDIPKQASILTILRILWSNQSIMRKIYIPDGYSTKQIISLIENNSDLTGDLTDTLNEGNLISGTFIFSFGTTRNKILSIIKEHATNVRNRLWSQNNYFNDMNQWIIFASLLEKEGYDYEDKQRIAGVLFNRLKIGMRLQIDATLLYIKTNGLYNSTVTWNDILHNKTRYNSNYNTYIHKGLPPGPITNPSEQSLKASLNPVKSDNFYYRLVNQKHVFSKTFDSHKKSIRKQA